MGRGQAQYYTPEALRTIAKAEGLYIDFRLPRAAVGDREHRRRYVLFSYSSTVMEMVGDYFGRTAYPPVEEPVRQTPEAHALHQVARAAGQAGKSPSGLG